MRLGAPVRLNPFAPCEAPIPPAVTTPLTCELSVMKVGVAPLPQPAVLDFFQF